MPTIAEVEVRIKGDNRDALKKLDEARSETKRAAGDMNAAIKGMGGEYERSMRAAGGAVETQTKRLRVQAQVLGQVGEQAHRVGLTLTAALTTPALLAGKAGLALAGDFEQSMNVLKATSGATAAQMKLVSDAAKRLGEDAKLPGTSAVDAAQAMLELSKAGLSVTDTLGAAHGVLEMSAAGQLDNAKAATIAANALNSFGLKGTEATRVSDLLAAAANASSASVESLADGLSQSSAVYASAGLKIQNLTASLALMANKGIQGSDAGTSLKTMLLALQNPSKDAAEEIGKLGVHIYDAQGKMVEFRSIVDQFSTATANLTQKQRDHALAQIFGSDAVRAATVVFGGGVKAYDDMERAVTKAGAGAKMAAAINAGFKGSLDAATSAGQTMLQGFVEPYLPAITNFFKGTTKAVSAVDKWPKPLKDATLGIVGLGAAGGVTAIALGTIASSIRSVVGLTATFEGAMTAEGVAVAGLGTAAEGASVRVGLLRKAILGIRGMALPAIAGFSGYEFASWLGSDLEKKAHDARAGNKKAYAEHENKAVGQARKIYRQYGEEGLMEDAGKPGILYTVADAKAAIQAEKEAANAKMYGDYNRSREQSRDAYDAKRSAEEKAAAARRYAALDVAGVPKKLRVGGGGGGHALSSGEKAAKQDAQELAQEQKSLADQLYETTKAIALQGNASESASVAYDLFNGRTKAGNTILAMKVVQSLRAKEATEKGTEAQKKAKDAADDWAKTTAQHWATMALQQGGLSDLDRVSLDLHKKRYAALTSEQSRKEVLFALDEERAAKDKDRRDAGATWAKETLAGLQGEIDRTKELTRVQQVLASIADQRKQGNPVNGLAAAVALLQAKAIDVRAQNEGLKKYADFWKEIGDRIRKAREEQEKGAADRYAEAQAGLAERIALTGSASQVTTSRMRQMALSFGVGATEADRIRTGMGRAKEVMEATLRVERIEAFQERLKKMADTVTDTFAGMFDSLFQDGFSGFFGNVMTGFRKMLADMAREYLASQIRGVLSRVVSSALGGLFGGGGSGGGLTLGAPAQIAGAPQMAAVGGPVLSNRAVLVGENGPELFIPSGNGRIATNAQTMGLGGGITVNQYITTPDVGSFRASKTQLALEASQEIAAASRAFR